MGTRSAAFSAKIRSLRELQTKISQTGVHSVNQTGPNQPGMDLSNSYRWFSTTLLSILRDVPKLPYQMIRSREKDDERLSLFPNLDYKDLYDTLYDFIPDMQYVTNPEKCGKNLLILFASLLPFMDRATIEDFPYNMTELIDVLPLDLCVDAVDVLCDNLLPFILVSGDIEGRGNDYVPAMLQTVMYKAPQNTLIHRKLVECIMTYKVDVHIDLLHVIAYGPTSAKIPAVNLFFFYWPTLNPTPADRKDIVDRFQTSSCWAPPFCTNINCEANEPAQARKMCLDHSIPLNQRSDFPPPALYCLDCADKAEQKRPKTEGPIFEDLNMPISFIDTKCENKNCRSTEKIGVVTCLSAECTLYNSHRPVRYCEQCHRIRHNERRGTSNHVIQKNVPVPWEMDPEDREVMLASVISLLALAKPINSASQDEHYARTMLLLDAGENEDHFSFDEYLLASRYGVWLLVGLCLPHSDEAALETTGLVSMLFEWYKVTATLPNDKTGALVEKMKSEYLPSWLSKLCKSYNQVFVQCLIPEPHDYARVGGHWQVCAPETHHIKEGLARLFCLVSFDIITLDLWLEIAPRWMQAIQTHYLKENLHELGSVFCRLFDPDMSPLGFELEEIYLFASRRIQNQDIDQQQDVLNWMQTLCDLGVTIPLEILYTMYSTGLKQWRDKKTLSEEEKMKLVQVYSKMIDVLLTQYKHQDIEEHVGMAGNHTQRTLSLTLDMITSAWLEELIKSLSSADGQHSIDENLFVFVQLLRSILKYTVSEEIFENDGENNSIGTGHTVVDEDKKDKDKDKKQGIQGVGGFMAVLSSTFKTTVETLPEDSSDTESIETDSNNELIKESSIEFEDHPVYMQLLSRLFILVTELEESGITYYILESIKCLALNEEGLLEMSKKYKKLFIWLQGNHIIPTMWKLLDTNTSQIATIAVPLLLHSAPLRSGSSILWAILDKEFNDPDWKVRFGAVEKTVLMFRMLDTSAVHKYQGLRSVLSHAFCLLLSSVDDISSHVSQRATIYAGTIHDKALKDLIYCLECQFDLVDEDRPHILKTLYQLFNLLIDRKILTWEFFASRFEVLISEILDRDSEYGPSSQTKVPVVPTEKCRRPTDDSVRSLVLTSKYPYKRTCSAPAGITLANRNNKHDEVQRMNSARNGDGNKFGERLADSNPGRLLESGQVKLQEEEKNYARQQSAPLIRHKISKTGSESLGSKFLQQSANGLNEMDLKNLAGASIDGEDKQTIHLMVFLFMQFLSNPEQALIPENKTSMEHGSMQKCFQYLFALIGFDEKESRFTTMPHKMRITAQFSSFFAVLPQVLDSNFLIGNYLLHTILHILQKSPFPPRYTTNWQPYYSMLQENLIYQGNGYTLWFLEPTSRKNWLEACLVIVYKYNFSEPDPLSEKVLALIRIIINSLSAHVHVCSKYFKYVEQGLTMRSRELSETSLGLMGTVTLQGTEENSAYNSRASPSSNNKAQDEDIPLSPLDAKDMELETIFEHAKSSSNSPDGMAKNISVENPLFFNILPDENPDMEEFLPGGTANGSNGWSMQVTETSRTFYSDSSNSHKFPVKRKGPFFNSPPSPLSLMDVLTVGSCKDSEDRMYLADMPEEQEVDEEDEEYLQPNQERLLPIGGYQETRRPSKPKHNNMSLLDRVWQVLGSSDQTDDCVPLVEKDLSGKVKIAAEDSMNKIAQDITDQIEVEERTLDLQLHTRLSRIDEYEVGSCIGPMGDPTPPSQPLELASPPPQPFPPPLRQRKSGTVKEPLGIIDDMATDSFWSQANTTKDTSRDEENTDKDFQNNQLNNHQANSVNIQQTYQQVDYQSYQQQAGYQHQKTGHQHQHQTGGKTRQSNLRTGEDTVVNRCSRCGAIQERYSYSEISLSIVVMNTLIHREPELAAPLLPEIFLVVSRIAGMHLYSWEEESNNIIIPGNPRSVARQFLRVTLQQLSANGIFPLLFKLDLGKEQRKKFFQTIVNCLNDFYELTPIVPFQLFLENTGNLKTNLDEILNVSLPNVTCYLSFIQVDHITNWSTVFGPLETFYRNLSLFTSSQDGSQEKADTHSKCNKIWNLEPVLSLIVFTMKMPGLTNHRSIIEPITKILCFAIQSCTFRFQDLVDICSLCNKAFSKERDKNNITKAITAEFVHALKFKTCIPDQNFLYLGSMMLQDAKGDLPHSSILEDAPTFEMGLTGPIHTGATECLRPHIPDIVEFVADVHTLSKVKSNVRGTNMSLNQDTLGGILKAALSQFLALEIARMSGDRDTKFVSKYLPWLFNPPSTIVAQGPKEFLDCVAHIRLLSWLLLGAVNHTLLVGSKENKACQPIPLEASCHIADHIEVILAGFAEQSKTSVVHMCSLFHSFILCQLWTVYLENIKPNTNNKEDLLLAPSILLDFWVKVTPGILQLVSHSKVLAEMVNLHFLSLMEALLECRSTILTKLMPLWCPVFYAYNKTLPDHICVRLRNIQDATPVLPKLEPDTKLNGVLVNWLQRLQFKIGQIELQASNATQQFFSV